MKKTAKNGFTVTELLIVLTFIGFVIIQQLLVVNRKMNEYGASYYNAFNTIRKVSYNIYIDTYCPNADNPPGSIDDDDPHKDDYDCTKGPRAFPFDSNELCRRYVEYLNIPPDSINCSATNVDAKAETLTTKNGRDGALRFKTSNAYRFYISDNGGNPYEYEVNRSGSDQKEKVEYFIVYVDLNGERMPNSPTVTNFRSKILPDIVPFAVSRKGEVIPIGFPTVSTNYLVSRVRFPDDPNDLDANGVPKEHLSQFLNFRDARNIAWPNGTTDIDIPYSWRLFDTSTFNANVARTFYTEHPEIVPNPVKADKVTGSELCMDQTYNCSVIINKSEHVRQ